MKLIDGMRRNNPNPMADLLQAIAQSSTFCGNRLHVPLPIQSMAERFVVLCTPDTAYTELGYAQWGIKVIPASGSGNFVTIQ